MSKLDWFSFTGQTFMIVALILMWLDGIKLRKENKILGMMLHKYIKDNCENKK